MLITYFIEKQIEKAGFYATIKIKYSIKDSVTLESDYYTKYVFKVGRRRFKCID